MRYGDDVVGPTGVDVEGRQVLVVDDDEEVRGLVGAWLEEEGYRVRQAHDGPPALESARSRPPDLVVLDVLLPSMSGFEALTRLRQIDARLPVILVSARPHDGECFSALELGADDCILKPITRTELVARASAVIRRARGAHRSEGLVLCDGLAIDVDAREVSVNGTPVTLTAKEFDVLAFLASNPRRVYTREQLLAKVWNSSAQWQDPDTVTEHVRRIRRKIEADCTNPRWVTTVRGVGYRFQP